MNAVFADPDEGLRLARQWCTSCHIVAPSPVGSDAAPPFETIANDPMVTEGGLRAWLANPHPPMPKFNLTRTEIGKEHPGECRFYTLFWSLVGGRPDVQEMWPVR